MVETKGEEGRRLPGLAELQPPVGGGASASEPRLYIRANFDEVTAARARGVTWQQIAGVLHAAGVRGAAGGALDWRQVKALFHAERYAREEAAKRAANPAPKKPRGKLRRRRVAVAEVPAPSSPSALGSPVTGPGEPEPPAPAVVDNLSPPAAGSSFSTGDPALDRALNSVRTLKPLPPSDLPGGWRGGTKPTKGSGGDGEGG